MNTNITEKTYVDGEAVNDLALELSCIPQSLRLLAKEFEYTDRRATLSNEIVNGALLQIANHIERICNDLDDVVVYEYQEEI